MRDGVLLPVRFLPSMLEIKEKPPLLDQSGIQLGILILWLHAKSSMSLGKHLLLNYQCRKQVPDHSRRPLVFLLVHQRLLHFAVRIACRVLVLLMYFGFLSLLDIRYDPKPLSSILSLSSIGSSE